MLDITSLLHQFGYLAIFAVIFIETGILIGFWLPGDSFLFSAAVLASANFLNLWIAILIAVVAAILGNALGYYFGNKYGVLAFAGKSSRFLNERQLERSEKFFSEHGGKAVILSRFVPVLRTVIPVLAGIGKMDKRLYTYYNVIGAFVWIFSVMLTSFYLGKAIPNANHYLAQTMVIIIIVSFLPAILSIFKKQK